MSGTCQFCGQYYVTVNAHVDVHLKIKKFGCPTCGKKFAKNCNLKEHIDLIHLQSKSKCTICGLSVKSQSLRRHVQTHYPREKKTCPIVSCDTRYYSPESLLILSSPLQCNLQVMSLGRDEYDPDVIPATPDALRQRLSAYIVPRPTELPLLPPAGTILSKLIPIEVML